MAADRKISILGGSLPQNGNPAAGRQTGVIVGMERSSLHFLPLAGRARSQKGRFRAQVDHTVRSCFFTCQLQEGHGKLLCDLPGVLGSQNVQTARRIRVVDDPRARLMDRRCQIRQIFRHLGEESRP